MSEPVFQAQGMPCRLAARRPRDHVLVEFLDRGHLRPLGTYREFPVEKIESARISRSHLRQLLAVLPEVAFITDERTTAADDYWWNRI